MFKTQVEPRAAGEWFHCQVHAFAIPYKFMVMQIKLLVGVVVEYRNIPAGC